MDTVYELAAALYMTTNEISRLNKIIEALMTNPKKTNKPEKDWDTKQS